MVDIQKSEKFDHKLEEEDLSQGYGWGDITAGEKTSYNYSKMTKKQAVHMNTVDNMILGEYAACSNPPAGSQLLRTFWYDLIAKATMRISQQVTQVLDAHPDKLQTLSESADFKTLTESLKLSCCLSYEQRHCIT